MLYRAGVEVGHMVHGREVRWVLLLFWCLYFAAVCLTNLLDLLQGLGTLPERWRYLAVILWQGIAAWHFWQALGQGEMTGRAFAVAIGLWATFLLADELLLTYALEAVHLRLFIAQLLSLLVIPRSQA